MQKKNPVPLSSRLPQKSFAMSFFKVLDYIKNLPARLVILLSLSFLAAVATGIFLKVGETVRQADKEFPPFRVEADASGRPLELRGLEGVWLHNNEHAAMQLTIKSDRFELIVLRGKPDSQSNIRYFARGLVRVSGDLVAIGQRSDMGKPIPPPGRFYEFMPMLFKSLNARVVLDGREMNWTIPASELKLQAPSFMAIMPIDQTRPMVWVRQQAE